MSWRSRCGGVTARCANRSRSGSSAPVLAGDRDELVALDLSLSLYRQLPNAELAVCPRADHGAATTPARAPSRT